MDGETEIMDCWQVLYEGVSGTVRGQVGICGCKGGDMEDIFYSCLVYFRDWLLPHCFLCIFKDIFVVMLG